MTTLKKNLLLELKEANTSELCSKLLKQFYNETVRLVYGFCQKKGLSAEDAEEITQIVYLQIFNKRHLYNPLHNPLAWLYIITKSETKDFLKARSTYKSYVTEFSDFLSQTTDFNPSTDQEIDMESLLGSSDLTENETAVLKMRYGEEKEFDEIAKTLKTSPLNIRKIVSRGLKKLKERKS